MPDHPSKRLGRLTAQMFDNLARNAEKKGLKQQAQKDRQRAAQARRAAGATQRQRRASRSK